MKSTDKKILEVLDDLRGAYNTYARWNDLDGNEVQADDAFEDVKELSRRLEMLLFAEQVNRDQRFNPELYRNR